MAESDNEQAKRVRSAKTWLEKAEKSFDQHASVRGELNLMLAEAEMKNLRKNHQSGQKLRRLAAAGTVLLSVVIVLAAYSLIRHDEPVRAVKPQHQISELAPAAVPKTEPQHTTAVFEDQQESSAAEIPEEPSPSVSPGVPAPDVSEGGIAQYETVQAAENNPAPEAVSDTSPAPAAKVMTDREVQAAVQDARHSLRGTAEKK